MADRAIIFRGAAIRMDVQDLDRAECEHQRQTQYGDQSGRYSICRSLFHFIYFLSMFVLPGIVNSSRGYVHSNELHINK